MKLHRNERCPIHSSFFCVDENRKSGTRVLQFSPLTTLITPEDIVNSGRPQNADVIGLVKLLSKE